MPGIGDPWLALLRDSLPGEPIDIAAAHLIAFEPERPSPFRVRAVETEPLKPTHSRHRLRRRLPPRFFWTSLSGVSFENDLHLCHAQFRDHFFGNGRMRKRVWKVTEWGVARWSDRTEQTPPLWWTILHNASTSHA